MSDPDTVKMSESPYHHGDLRRALLEAAGRQLRAEGPEGLSLRGIAREAGVSHAAPYHHFKDRESLLAAVAAVGFERLERAMREGAAAPGLRPLQKLQEAGVAYVRFAAGNPQLYRLMFSARLGDSSAHPDLAAAASAAFATLEEMLGHATSPDGGGPGALPSAGEAAWATVHGLAMLLIDGRLGDDVDAEQHARDVTAVLGRGLAPRSGETSDA